MNTTLQCDDGKITVKNGSNKKMISKTKNKQQQMADIQKPFIKWVGGKTQIINEIIPHIPAEMNNYREPFLGGGSVLLAVLSLRKQGQITIKGSVYAYDINEALIWLYKHVQTDSSRLYKYIRRYIDKYDGITGTTINREPNTLEEAKTSKESFYYWMRHKYNSIKKGTVKRSALFMILNKTCFRGMYREGPNGYNVPYGHYKKTPAIITKEELDNVSDLLTDVIFECADFQSSMGRIEKGDFVYLDPPYAPENSTSFVGYTVDGFDLATHQKLFKLIRGMDGKKNRFVLCNAKVDLVVSAFSDYNIQDVVARRAINSKKPGSTTMEVIVYN